jgi:hypothetical protein
VDKVDGGGTESGSGWVAVGALDWWCHCEHFKWSECGDWSIIERVRCNFLNFWGGKKKKKVWMCMDKSGGSGTTSGSGWVAVARIDSLRQRDHFEHKKVGNRRIIERETRLFHVHIRKNHIKNDKKKN